jgi:SAM-dependent methyltransferase
MIMPHTAPRAQKSEKILAVLHDFLGKDLSGCTCIDVGCSDGSISRRLAPHFKTLIGMDVDQPAVRSAAQEPASGRYAIASGHNIPFPDGCFDVAICAQVYEHVGDQPALAREVWRVLRPGGVCFFSGPNRLAFMEEHYWLPFLSWPPRPVSNFYMRLFRRGSYYDPTPLFYWQIRSLWSAFTIHDYNPLLIRQPQRFALQDRVGKYPWASRLPGWLMQALSPVYPNYNWILVKPT